MNSSSYNRKLEIYTEMQGLLSLKRRNKGRDISTFISIYLDSLTPYSRPHFHTSILRQLSLSVVQSINSSTNTAHRGTQTPISTQEEETEGGYDTPHPPTFKESLDSTTT